MSNDFDDSSSACAIDALAIISKRCNNKEIFSDIIDEEVDLLYSLIVSGEATRSDLEDVTDLNILWNTIIVIIKNHRFFHNSQDISEAAASMEIHVQRFIGAFMSTLELLIDSQKKNINYYITTLKYFFSDDNSSIVHNITKLVENYRSLFSYSYTFNRRTGRHPIAQSNLVNEFLNNKHQDDNYNLYDNDKEDSYALEEDSFEELHLDEHVLGPMVTAPSILPLKPISQITEDDNNYGSDYQPHSEVEDNNQRSNDGNYDSDCINKDNGIADDGPYDLTGGAILSSYYKYRGWKNVHEEDEDSENDNYVPALSLPPQAKRVTRMRQQQANKDNDNSTKKKKKRVKRKKKKIKTNLKDNNDVASSTDGVDTHHNRETRGSAASGGIRAEVMGTDILEDIKPIAEQASGNGNRSMSNSWDEDDSDYTDESGDDDESYNSDGNYTGQALQKNRHDIITQRFPSDDSHDVTPFATMSTDDVEAFNHHGDDEDDDYFSKFKLPTRHNQEVSKVPEKNSYQPNSSKSWATGDRSLKSDSGRLRSVLSDEESETGVSNTNKKGIQSNQKWKLSENRNNRSSNYNPLDESIDFQQKVDIRKIKTNPLDESIEEEDLDDTALPAQTQNRDKLGRKRNPLDESIEEEDLDEIVLPSQRNMRRQRNPLDASIESSTEFNNSNRNSWATAAPVKNTQQGQSTIVRLPTASPTRNRYYNNDDTKSDSNNSLDEEDDTADDHRLIENKRTARYDPLISSLSSEDLVADMEKEAASSVYKFNEEATPDINKNADTVEMIDRAAPGSDPTGAIAAANTRLNRHPKVEILSNQVIESIGQTIPLPSSPKSILKPSSMHAEGDRSTNKEPIHKGNSDDRAAAIERLKEKVLRSKKEREAKATANAEKDWLPPTTESIANQDHYPKQHSFEPDISGIKSTRTRSNSAGSRKSVTFVDEILLGAQGDSTTESVPKEDDGSKDTEATDELKICQPDSSNAGNVPAQLERPHLSRLDSASLIPDGRVSQSSSRLPPHSADSRLPTFSINLRKQGGIASRDHEIADAADMVNLQSRTFSAGSIYSAGDLSSSTDSPSSNLIDKLKHMQLPPNFPLPRQTEFGKEMGTIFEGYLSKKGSGMIGRWQQRYVMFSESSTQFCVLRIYTKAVDSAWGAVPLGLRSSIPLAAIESVAAVPKSKNEFIIKYTPRSTTSDEQTIGESGSVTGSVMGSEGGFGAKATIFQSDSPQSRMVWVEVLNRALQIANEMMM